MESKLTAIRAIKQEVRLQEWSAQIKAQQTSVMTVRQWCVEKGIKPATYYYHLRLLREQCIEKMSAIVPLTAPQTSSNIHMEKNGLQIVYPAPRTAPCRKKTAPECEPA